MVSEEPQPFFASDSTDVNVDFGAPQAQSRVTLAFRGLLVLPHVVVLYILSVLALLLAVAGWFAALITGRLPRVVAQYEMSVIAYAVRVSSYGYMLAGVFPAFGFADGEFPVRVEIRPSRLSRLKVLFRLPLIIPAYIVTAAAGSGLLVLSPILWLVTLVLGRMPQPVFSATAAVIRYQARYSAYIALVTDAYPRRLRGDSSSDWAPEGFRLSLSDPARWLVAAFVVIGAGLAVWSYGLAHSRPGPDYNVVGPEARAEAKLQNVEDNSFALRGCNLGCEKSHEHALGEAYLRFASSISRIPFLPTQIRGALRVVRDARLVGRAFLAASTSKDGGRASGIDPADLPDSPPAAEFDTEVAAFDADITRGVGPGPGSSSP